MRIESSVTAISWIPSDAIEGMPTLPFELGVARYDEPPPEHLEEGDLERLRAADRFREANRLAAWIDVEDGKIVSHGYEGTGLVGSGLLNLGVTEITIPAVVFEVLRHEPEVQANAVRFVQTVGGRAGFPAPRRVIGGNPSGSIPRTPGRRSRSRSERTAPRNTSSSMRARSPGTGSTTGTEISPRSPGRSTSRPGTAGRTASERHGATRSPTRSSRPQRAPSNERSRAS